jgi:hypothetical protein
MTIAPALTRWPVISVPSLALVLLASPASAQDTVSGVLSFLLTNQAVVTDDFANDRDAAAATRDTVSRYLQISLATLPISSSAGGFIYRFNPSLGTVERASDTFGPFFLERALTSGRGQTSVGFTFRHASFDTIDGRDLRDGSLVTTANQLAAEAAPFDVDTLTLRLDAATYTLFGSYGVTDRLDIGAAVPVVNLSVSGERQNVYRGTVLQQARGSAFAAGVADISIRTRYGVWQSRYAGLAAAAEIRLPTGDEAQLLGAGRAGMHVSALASMENGRIGTHARIGIGRGGASNEVSFGAAAVAAVTPRFNLIGEVLGRRLGDLAGIRDVAAPHPQLPNVSTLRLLPADRPGTTVLGVTGFKWNLAGTWLLNANVVFPLSTAGLSAGATPSLAIDYTFDRR